MFDSDETKQDSGAASSAASSSSSASASQPAAIAKPSSASAIRIATAAPQRTVHDVIDEWFVKHFHGLGPELTEFMHAKLHAAKEELKSLIRPVPHS